MDHRCRASGTESLEPQRQPVRVAELHELLACIACTAWTWQDEHAKLKQSHPHTEADLDWERLSDPRSDLCISRLPSISLTSLASRHLSRVLERREPE